MTAVEVKALVRTSLKKHQDASYPIHVVRVGPEPKDGQWQVLVEPERQEPSPRYRYYDMLSEVEDEIAKQGVSVFLTPAPEADYHYEVDGEKVEVTRRERTLFVSTEPWRGFAASYSLEGEFRSEVYGGKADSPQGPMPRHLLDRFHKAVLMYIEEKKHRDTRARASMSR